MIRRFSILLFMISFGFVLIPAMTYACGKGHKKTEKSYSKEESTSKTEQKDLCKKDPCKSEHSKKGKGCGSNCNHANCKCVHFTITIALPQETMNDTSINFSLRKQTAVTKETNLSPGYHSIWQPPKIS